MSSGRRIGVVVNELDSLVLSQATWLILHGLEQRGHEVVALPTLGLGVNDKGSVTGAAIRIHGSSPDAFRGDTATTLQLQDLDLAIMRTNPGRDSRTGVHTHAMALLVRAEREGLTIINSPSGLLRAASKLYLTEFPADIVPRSIVTRDIQLVRDFVHAENGPCVLKPITGTRGQDVFFLDGPESSNLNQLVDVIARREPLLVQSYVPEATDGDIRLIVLDGSPLVLDGHPCAVRRVPRGGDFRSNIHAGGTAARADPTPAQLKIAERAGAKLKRDGILLAGLDIIGSRIVEINVFSTGGFGDAQKFSGVDFLSYTLDWFEAQANKLS